MSPHPKWEAAEAIRERIVAFLEANPGAQFYRIDAHLGLPNFRAVDRALQTLRRLGRIERDGSGWRVPSSGSPPK